jgi:hypothetical protein
MDQALREREISFTSSYLPTAVGVSWEIVFLMRMPLPLVPDYRGGSSIPHSE